MARIVVAESARIGVENAAEKLTNLFAASWVYTGGLRGKQIRKQESAT
jgi:hypothetical protein